MKLKLSKDQSQQLGLAVLLTGLGLYLYAGYLVGPLWRKASSLGQRLREAQQELHMLQVVTADEATLRQEHQRLSEAVVAVGGQLPGEGELPGILELLSGLASRSQVKIQTIVPQRPVTESAATRRGEAPAPSEALGYTKIQILIDALAGYHQLGTFLALVEAAEKPMHVSTLRVSGHDKLPKQHAVKLTLTAYFAASSEESASSNASTAF